MGTSSLFVWIFLISKQENSSKKRGKIGFKKLQFFSKRKREVKIRNTNTHPVLLNFVISFSYSIFDFDFLYFKSDLVF